MLEVEVKNYYFDKLYGKTEFKEFANSINNETVILFSLKSKDCIVLYQKDFNYIKVGIASFPKLKNIINRDVVSSCLKNKNIPEKYTMIKAEKDRSYVFVSEKYRDAFDVSLVQSPQGIFDWEVIPKKYSKEKYPTISLSGKIQE